MDDGLDSKGDRLILRRLIWLYRRLLSLYPADYRQDFADEMQTIFAQALHDAAAHSDTRLLQFLLREFLTLPVCIMQEYYQLRYDYQEQLMRKIRRLQLTRRLVLGIITGMLLLIGLFSVIPFTAFILNPQNPPPVEMHYFSDHVIQQSNATADSFFSGEQLSGFYVAAAYLTVFFVPITIGVSVPVTLLLVKSWAGIGQKERRVTLTVCSAWMGLFLFIISPTGQTMLGWILD